jgi:putative membrane protein
MHLLQAASVPYCGAPPDPHSVFYRWNLDPILIAILLGLLLAYFLDSWRRGLLTHRSQIFFCSGWLLSSLALVSPLCPLSVSLFSARVTQHMLLVLLGAPLIAAGWERTGLTAQSRGALLVQKRHASRFFSRSATLSASIAFAAILWLWHTPFFYALTFSSTFTYWTMHSTLFGSALYLWWCLLDPESGNALKNTGAAALASIQMSLLGAIITFAPRAMYSPHFFTTHNWYLTALQDQQLGGVIMWVPGCVVFLLISTYLMSRVLAPSQNINLSLN